jgi:hypothetical protein
MRNLIATLHQLRETLLFSLCKLNEIQFSAPWEPAQPRCRG